jgi:NAD(P)-dependent dehydrogenase (short-subunit alcohol dehydrogenase family)
VDVDGIALVTGASRGIGRAVALELAGRGFDTVATMRDPSAGVDLVDAADGRKGRLRVERLDVTDASSIHMPDGLRVVVNNAGTESDNLPLEIMPVDFWRRIIETNVIGLVAVTRAAIPKLRAAGGGVICNVTSSSILAPVPYLGAYRASKAAVSALGESLQAEVAQFGIRVVEILPGPIITDMLESSDRPAPAIEYEQYRAQAEKMWESRQAIRAMYTPASEAARRIVDAILDDDGPLRYGCDDLSDGMLKGWRSVASDDDWLRPMLDAFAAPGSGSA